MSSLSSLRKIPFKASASELKGLVKTALEKLKSAGDSIAQIPDGQHSFDNVVLLLEKTKMEVQPVFAAVKFHSKLNPNKEERDAAAEREKEISTFLADHKMRKDVYDSFLAFLNTQPKLDSLPERLVNKLSDTFKRDGLHLDEATRKQVNQLTKDITNYSVDYLKLLGEDATSLTFRLEELEGMPARFMEEHAANEDGTVTLTMKYPDYLPVLKFCSVPQTREKMAVAYKTRFPENVARVQQTFELRHRRAQLLGFPTHAHLALSDKMAKTPETVTQFQQDMLARVRGPVEEETQELRRVKAAALGVGEDCPDANLTFYDLSYYSELLRKQKYDLDSNILREYFPSQHVISTVSDLYAAIFNIKIEPLPAAVSGEYLIHPDQSLFSVTDGESGVTLGHIIFDLHPRDGKYSHACCDVLVSSITNADGFLEQTGVVNVIANFPKPTPTTPALLNFSDVTTFMHEMGHALHFMLSKAPYIGLVDTEWDFVEVPSQMLENFAYERRTLRRLSSHYQTGTCLPDDLVEKVIAVRNVGVGLFLARQLVFSIFDMRMHTLSADNPLPQDICQCAREISQNIVPIPPYKHDLMPASFAHMYYNYDAGYYGYMWADVFACDVFSKFEEAADGPVSPTVGNEYRDKIILQGGRKDGFDLLRDFLSREPSLDAYLKLYGLLPRGE
eukprot:GCRY01004953.1.p1 GENE.GCRY01004953.1~~GCRY01004953.1.p1  ORF type:complete len:675 (-),score=152.86 GCRY01004953.1:430-2454(-)